MMIPMIGFGQCTGNCQNGYGTYVFSGGKYVGEWSNYKYHGQGTYTWNSGMKYVGGWKNGKYHGEGIMTWGPNSKTKYIGGYKNGMRHGEGILTKSCGQILKGLFQNDTFIE